MTIRRAEEAVRELLSESDIIVGGRRPWDLRVATPAFFERALEGSLAVGEAYVEGWWECDRLDQLFHRVYLSGMRERPARGVRGRLEALRQSLSRRRRAETAPRALPLHERLGGDLFRAMLGERMAYNCAYWSDAGTLDEAQEAQYELVCRKLELQPGMTVLEYGCGWGAFARYAAERHGAGVLGLCGSLEQAETARSLCRDLPVEISVQDYREVYGRFDRVVSIGLVDHLGPDRYRDYMENAARCLKDDGISFIHTIGRNTSESGEDPWLDRYVRPHGAPPSLRQLTESMEGLFVMEDCHNIGPQYDPTMLAWQANLERDWPSLQPRYGEREFRMMKYYLLSSAGSFRARRSQVFQLVMTKVGRRQPRCRVDVEPQLDLRKLLHK